MPETYLIECDCRSVSMRLTGAPRVRGHCHCNACRTLLDTPFHSVTAWDPDQVEIERGPDILTAFKPDDLSMKKVFCSRCGEVLYNTNKMDWRVISQHLLKKNLGELPEPLRPLSHFHYEGRLFDIDDPLPKKS